MRPDRWPDLLDRRNRQWIANSEFIGYRDGCEVTVLFNQWPDDGGFQRRWFLLFHRLGEDQVYYVPVLAQTILTTGAGSNQTLTSDPTWNNANNSVEGIAGGASGGNIVADANNVSGGGGGAYNKITNFTFATPGTTTATYRIGVGGAGVSTHPTNGNNGGQTWFNSTVYPTTGTALGCDPGKGGTQSNGTANGGAGGAIANNYPANTGFAGGRGGNATGDGITTFGASGAGGAGGPNAAGNQGVDANNESSGGQGDGSFGGVGGTSGDPGTAGGNGTEWGTAGSGGGGGATSASLSGETGGKGGLYGGGGAACSGTTSSTSGAGAQGVIVLTWAVGTAAKPSYQRSLADDHPPWQQKSPYPVALYESTVKPPFIPSYRGFGVDDPPTWQWQKSYNVALYSGNPFVNRRDLGYDDAPPWQRLPQRNLALLAPVAVAKPFTPSYPQFFADDLAWQWRTPYPVALYESTVKPFTPSYPQFSVDDPSAWQWQRSYPLALYAGRPFNPLYPQFSVDDLPSWQQPLQRNAALLTTVAVTKPVSPSYPQFTVDDPSVWQWRAPYPAALYEATVKPFNPAYPQFTTDDPPSWQRLTQRNVALLSPVAITRGLSRGYVFG
jgi:hypothetical protein